MPLEKRPVRASRPKGASFRFSQDGIHRLKVLARALNTPQIDILETLLGDEYQRCKKKYPEEVRKAEKALTEE
jgi:hypothetical protein